MLIDKWLKLQNMLHYNLTKLVFTILLSVCNVFKGGPVNTLTQKSVCL